MAIIIDAIYENGLLKPSQPLSLEEHEKVRISIQTNGNRVLATAGLIQCSDADLIERIALDPIEEL